MSARGTRAVEIVRRAKVAHALHEYATDGPAAERAAARSASSGGLPPSYGEAAAAALGVEPERVFKTLVAVVDDRLVAAIVAVTGELDLKRLADAVGGRRARMADPSEAERATGYVVGGISPLGQRRRLPTVLDASATGHETIFVSAGRRGLQLEIDPGDLARLAGATVAPIGRGIDPVTERPGVG
jgi:Cys-tRNA(Pro)/Cys-tRNA(Cys) deacylase